MSKLGRPTLDISGEKFGLLTVLKRDFSSTRKDAVWLCKCDCGNETAASSHDLRYGRKKSCGCATKKLISDSKIKDVAGLRFGRLVTIEQIGFDKHHRATWKCKCDCGNFVNVNVNNLIFSRTQSCGCLHKENFNRKTHNESKTRLYRIWCGMRARCYSSKSNVFKWYGGKGIKVCEEWNENYESFRDWAMANGYEEGLSIDRINSNGNYEPSNCRWLTRAENARIAAKEMQRRRSQ